jgi:transposase-like protein
MSLVTDEDGMAKRASQMGDAHKIDCTGADDLGVGFRACGQRRRWTAEQKRQIVAEGMQPGMSAAMVARRHGISSGQFYAWRQQLLLCGARTDKADAGPSLAGVDAATNTPYRQPAIPVPPAPGTATTAPVLSDEPLSMTQPDGVRGQLGDQADRSGDRTPSGASVAALPRLRHGDRVNRIGGSPVPRQQPVPVSCLGLAGDDASEPIGQPSHRLGAVQLCRPDQSHGTGPALGASVAAREERILPGQGY